MLKKGPTPIGYHNALVEALRTQSAEHHTLLQKAQHNALYVAALKGDDEEVKKQLSSRGFSSLEIGVALEAAAEMGTISVVFALLKHAPRNRLAPQHLQNAANIAVLKGYRGIDELLQQFKAKNNKGLILPQYKKTLKKAGHGALSHAASAVETPAPFSAACPTIMLTHKPRF